MIAASEDKLVAARTIQFASKKFKADFKTFEHHAHYLMREPGWEKVAEDCLGWLEQVGAIGPVSMQ